MKKIILLLFLVMFFCPAFSDAATYYVDYDSGADTNNGTSSGTPFKHCPGDANATDNADINLSAGDTVYFKGGVVYRGKISATTSGTSGNLITYDGAPDGWGTGNATISGSEPITGWTVCSNAEDCLGNANYASIYKADLPATSTVWSPLWESNTMLYMTQNPAPTDRYWYDDLTNYWTYTSATTTSVTDTTHLTSSDSSYYSESFIQVYGSPNAVYCRKITGFDTGTDTVSWSTATGTPANLFSIMNNINDLTEAGLFFIDDTNDKIYLWPNIGPPSGITIGARTACVDLNGKNYITVKNFTMRDTYGAATSSTGLGTSVGNSGAVVTDIIVDSITITDIQTLNNHGAALGFSGATSAANLLIQNNDLTNIRGGRGIMVGSNTNGVTIHNNTIQKPGYTAIYIYADNAVISNNTVSNVEGVHANGIAIYQGCDTVTVKNNKILLDTANYALAVEVSNDLTFYNNVFKSSGLPAIVRDGAGTGFCRFYNNTFYTGLSLRDDDMTFTVTNNIITGGLGPTVSNSWSNITHTYNVYYGLVYQQDPDYSWVTGTGELNITCGASSCSIDDSDKDAIFTNPSSNDFSLVIGALPIDVGSTLGSPYNVDILSVARPQGAAWDIGAYEYQGSSNDLSIRMTVPANQGH